MNTYWMTQMRLPLFRSPNQKGMSRPPERWITCLFIYLNYKLVYYCLYIIRPDLKQYQYINVNLQWI